MGVLGAFDQFNEVGSPKGVGQSIHNPSPAADTNCRDRGST